jgi:hypothetical protein
METGASRLRTPTETPQQMQNRAADEIGKLEARVEAIKSTADMAAKEVMSEDTEDHIAATKDATRSTQGASTPSL